LQEYRSIFASRVEITESGGVIKILPVYHYLGTLFTGGLLLLSIRAVSKLV